MKSNKRYFVSSLILLATMVGVTSTATAQTLGTIGVGELTYSAKVDSALRSEEAVIDALELELNRALLDTRKFSVLDNAQLQERMNKQGLQLQDYYLGKHTDDTRYIQAGLDYILTVDVNELSLENQANGAAASSAGMIELDFKLIGVADLTTDYSSSVSAQITQSSASVLDQAINQAVDQLVNQTISVLFPIRVMEIAESGQVKLNYGNGVLAAGDTVLVYSQDESAESEDGGNVVGEPVATLQIVTAEKKFSTARVLNGYDALQKGQRGELQVSGS